MSYQPEHSFGHFGEVGRPDMSLLDRTIQEIIDGRSPAHYDRVDISSFLNIDPSLRKERDASEAIGTRVWTVALMRRIGFKYKFLNRHVPIGLSNLSFFDPGIGIQRSAEIAMPAMHALMGRLSPQVREALHTMDDKQWKSMKYVLESETEIPVHLPVGILIAGTRIKDYGEVSTEASFETETNEWLHRDRVYDGRIEPEFQYIDTAYVYAHPGIDHNLVLYDMLEKFNMLPSRS